MIQAVLTLALQRVRREYYFDYSSSFANNHRLRQSRRAIVCAVHRQLTLVQVMLLDQGRIAEFDKPATLLADPSSKFHSLCKATGKNEFAVLKKMAGV